jgi:S1-C subfamily serine protease
MCWLCAAVLLIFSNAHAEVPAAGLSIQQAASVLSITTAGGATEFEASTDSGEVRSLSETLRSAGSVFESNQLEFCQHSTKPHCPVFRSAFLGSGFLLEPGFLVTAYHLLHHQILWNGKSYLGKANAGALLPYLRSSDLFLMGQNESGQNAISTVTDPAQIRIETINPSIYFLLDDNTHDAFERNLFGELSDIVVLRADIPGHKLMPAVIPLQPGEVATVAGFPAPILGSGPTLVQNSGRVLSAEEFEKITRLKEPKAAVGLRKKFMIFIDAPCPQGMSGGPITNTAGEVVGVIGGEYIQNRTHQHVCYGVNILALDQLSQFWKAVNDKALKPSRH